MNNRGQASDANIGADSVPVVRGGWRLLRHPWEFLAGLPAHGDLVQLRLGPWRTYVLCDPELTRQVLRDSRTFDKGGALFDQARSLMGNGLGTCPHDQHLKQRRSLQPAFARSRLPGYAAVMSAQAETFMDSWRDGDDVDIVDSLLTLGSSVIAKALFSVDLAPGVQESIVQDARVVVRGIFKRAFVPKALTRLPLPFIRRFDRATAHLRSTLLNIVTEYRTAQVDRNDFLSILLAHRDEEGGALTDREICDQLGTLFFAGIETVASALAWSFHILDRDPELRARIHAEVDEALMGRVPTWEDLPRLDLVRRVVLETLRLYAPGWFLSRVVTSETVLGGHRLPKGAEVFYSPLIIHHRAEYTNPESFDPDRWPPGEASHIPNTTSFIPFGGGTRVCIGDEFAMIESIIALASIVARWELRTVSEQPVRPALAISMAPRALRMRTVRRDAKNEHGRE